MSAGQFELSRYEASYGEEIHPIRIQPETATAAIGGTNNNPPAGAATNPISAVVSAGRRSKGLNPRLVSLRAPATGQPAGYLANGLTVIPALTEAFFNAAVAGAEVTYLGSTYTVVGRSPEIVR